MRKASFTVSGMSCVNCANRIEQNLAVQPGIHSTSVNFATSTLVVEFDEDLRTLEGIAEQVSRLGYTLQPTESASGELRFGVEGMHCASCVAKLEKNLLEHPGVLTAAVNLAQESAYVTFTPGMASQESIFAVVSSSGYTPVPPEAPSTSVDTATSQRNWFLFSIILSLPIMATMTLHGNLAIGWLNLVLASVVQFTAGLTFYRGSWYALKGGSANMDVLVALGTTAAYGYSLLAFFGLSGSHNEVFFETSAMLIAFIRLGKYLEARARGKASAALQELLHLQADKARLLVDGRERQVPVTTVKVGDVVVVRPGETIPVDGRVVAANAELAKKVYLLEDCTSPVVVPGVVDHTDAAQAAFAGFAKAGMQVVRSTDYIM